jgi:hypothetical protein
MMILSLVIENHLDELELLHGPDLLPSHRTVVAELRPLFWDNQRICYDLLLKTAWEMIQGMRAKW